MKLCYCVKIHYVSNWSQDVFVIKKCKNIVPWTYFVSDFKGEEELLERFTQMDC